MSRADPPDPAGLPRQRRGVTPQMHGRFPDYDVLEQAGHWDAVTRELVLKRVHEVPPFRFFDPEERAVLEPLCDVLTAQDAEPRIPVLNYVDEKYWKGELDGYQYFDMPDDRDTWRLVARGIDEEARRRAHVGFADAWAGLRHEIVTDFAESRLHGGVWDGLNVSHAFSVIMRGVVDAFYAHPWAWNEIGFGGPAYPRGYSRFGSPHLQSAEREEWEAVEAFEIDPVADVQERGMP